MRSAPPASDLKDPTRKSIPQTSQARPVAASTTQARAQLRDSLGRYAQVTVDQQTGGLQAVGRLDGYLTGRSSASATSIALGYVRAHATAFGLTQQDLDGLKLVRDYTSAPDGVRHLQWAQVVDGVTVADSSVLANVASDGRLVNVLGGARGGTLNRRSPAVSADGAYQRTLRSVGSRSSVPEQRSARSTGTRTTTYAGSGRAELVAYHAGSGLRLAWRVLAPVSADGTYDSLVDAADGRIARRANLVKFADALVFDAAPGDHPGGTQTRKPIGQWLAPGADHLEGDNAHAFADVRDEVGPVLTEDGFEDRFTPPSDGDVPPSSGSDWLYPIQSVPDATGECPADAPGCTWNHTVPDSWQLNRNEATTQLFYYVNKFHDHLLAAPIGFDAASGNFQGADKVFAQSDDGADTAAGLPDDAHQDNANFDTRPDGIPGLMQMYLFEPIPIAPGVQLPFASVNGSDDPQVVYHEYTHGLSNRLITDAQGYGATSGIQSGAMGEAWSDWYALDFLARQGFQRDDPAPGDVKEGEYVDNGQNLIRTEPTDCPPDAAGHRRVPRLRGDRAGRLHVPGLRPDRARRAGRRPPPRAARRRRDLGADAVAAASAPRGPLRAGRRLQPGRGLHHRRHAARAAPAVVPGSAQRDPAGVDAGRRGRHEPDLGGVRLPRHGLLRVDQGRLRLRARRRLLDPADGRLDRHRARRRAR